MEDCAKTFSENLRKLRKHKQMTQDQLAGALGYTEKAVSKWESGYSIPPVQTLIQLSGLFGVTLDDLFEESSVAQYFLGIDGGATKTTFALADKNGVVMHKITLGPSNPFDIGFSETCAVLESGINQICANIQKKKVSAFAGISGGGIKEMRERIGAFLSKFDFLSYGNDSDAINIITAGLGSEDGIIVIMGTGSSCFKRVNGEITRLGGHGYLFDHAGGGYDLGNAVISHSCKAEDGSGEDTVLTKLLCRELNTSTVVENISHFYSIGKSGIASFAPLVFEAYDMGDAVAEKILRDNMHHVAGLVHTAGKAFSDGKKIKVVCVGGLTKERDVLFPMIYSELEKYGEKEKFDVSAFDGDVVVGALIKAGAELT
jgi:N-acetylglucosamine kinase-like BadF-type ATPase